jgi:copper homeostasis protein
MADVLLEVCVDSTEGMLAAVAGGADRIELCSALEVGGMTPSYGQMRRAATVGVPVHALIRSWAGEFVFGPDEVATMLDDIGAAKAAGLAGVVIGAALADGRLDSDALARMRDAAAGLSVTLHRAFDLVPDFAEAVEMAVGLGLNRILTSGGAVGAPEGAEALARILGMARGRIGVLPAAGITSGNVAALLRAVPVGEVHSSCEGHVRLDLRAVALGFGAPQRIVTDEAEVRALKAAAQAA